MGRWVDMTGIKVALMCAAAALVGVIQSDHVEAFGKLSATAILGVVSLALIFLQWKSAQAHRKTVETIVAGHKEGNDKVCGKLDEMKDSHVELFREALGRRE